MPGTKSFIAKKGEVDQKWYAADATDQIVGRLASKIAVVLMASIARVIPPMWIPASSLS